MSLLARAGAWLVQILLGFFLEKVLFAVKKYKEAKDARQRLKDELALKVEKLKNAQTPEEQDAAADDLLKRF